MIVFGSTYARKKIHLLSAFLELFSISELALDKTFKQNASNFALCIHYGKE